jgi:hypothetical protein
MAETGNFGEREGKANAKERAAHQTDRRAAAKQNEGEAKLTMLEYACCRNKDGNGSVLPTWAVGVVLVSAEFESSSPNRKPVVLLLSSRPMSVK